MSDSPKLAAIVPARAGSQRFPGKNNASVGGRTLLQRTIDAIRETGLFSRIVLTTDDETLSADAASLNEVELVDRPEKLATSDATSQDVVRHAIEAKSLQNYTIVLLQLTSPLRTSRDISETVRLLTEKGHPSAVTVTSWRIPPSPPFGIVSESGKLGQQRLSDWPPPESPNGTSWAINGAVYAFRAEEFMQTGQFYSESSAIYHMPLWRSIDIDYREDLEFAAKLLRTDSENAIS